MKNKYIQSIRTWLLTGQRAIWLEYACLSLLVLLPLLLPGYILTLDLVFTPNIAWPTELSNTYPLEILLWLLGRILPGDIVEKIVLFSILLLSGVGMHLLIRALASPNIRTDAWQLAPYIGGICYMINPFTYSRFMAGQWMFLLGYALVPFFVRSLLRLVTQPSIKAGTNTGLWAFAIISVSIHHVGILAAIGAIFGVIAAVKYRHNLHRLKLTGLSLVAGAGVFLVLSSFWLVPTLLGLSAISHSTAGFDSTHFEAFSTDGGSTLGRLANVIRLQGFWVESQQLFALPQTITPGWGLLFLLLWIVVVIGGISALRLYRMAGGLAMISIISGILLSATPLISWMSTTIPLLAGYREPHKFASLIAFGFALLLAIGAGRIIAKTKRETIAKVLGLGFLILPLLLTPTMLWGFARQLSPRHYPIEWQETNDMLKQTVRTGEEVLFLPWHQYATYSFSGRLIANPAEKFFEVPIIASNDPEFADISPTYPDPKRQRLKTLLEAPSAGAAKQLSEIGIDYILLAKEPSQKQYPWLNTMSGIHKVHENTRLLLYTVEDKQ